MKNQWKPRKNAAEDFTDVITVITKNANETNESIIIKKAWLFPNLQIFFWWEGCAESNFFFKKKNIFLATNTDSVAQ